MKTLTILGMVIGFALPGASFAHLDSLDETTQLVIEAEALNAGVQKSNLGLSAKDAVARFEGQSRALSECQQRIFMYQNEETPAFSGCEAELEGALQSFQPVDNYLSFTSFGYPAIYSQYLRTRTVVEAIREPQDPGSEPAPGQPLFKAAGTLDNHAFEFSGAVRPEVRQRCMEYGSARKIRFVYDVQVNGKHFTSGTGAYLSLDQACGIVADQSLPEPPQPAR